MALYPGQPEQAGMPKTFTHSLPTFIQWLLVNFLHYYGPYYSGSLADEYSSLSPQSSGVNTKGALRKWPNGKVRCQVSWIKALDM